MRREASRPGATPAGVALLAAVVVGGCVPALVPAGAPDDRPPEAWWADRFAEADSLAVAELAPGARHVYLWLPAGPWAVHVVELDEAACVPEVAAVKAGPPLAARALTTTLGSDALAAVNADFFMIPGGTPVGAHVWDGRVLVGPGARPMYALDSAGRHWAGTGALAGYVVAGRDSVALAQVNRPPAGGLHHPEGDGLFLFDEWFGDQAPAGFSGISIRVLEHGGRRDGGRGLVVATHEADSPATLDAEHVALQARGAAADGWLRRLAPGDTVRWWARVVPARDPGRAAARGTAAVEAVGGFPMLVEDGRGVYDAQPGVIATFGPVRHPRTAVGWDEGRGRAFWVVVDGRQPPYSAGMSLPELEWLMLRLGVTHAINLDGGGSTALTVGGRLASRPSDAVGEREVANVLALMTCRRD
jgi:hypothetical protein